MKEYKIITLTPTSNSTQRSMEGYLTSCETSLNQLAREGWTLVCTESIAQQDMSNLMLFLERELIESDLLIKEESKEIPEEFPVASDAIIDYSDRVKLPEN